MPERLEFMKLHPAAKLPTRGSRFAAGLDLYSIESLTIAAHDRAVVGTGLAVAVPEGFYGRIAPRSGLAIKYGLDVLAGVVDADYRGEIMCALINHGEQAVEIEAGMRVAQLLIETVAAPEAVWVENLSETQRGEGGFGSTGEA